MVDFRFHLVSVIAVLFALAIGVALGSGALGGPLLDRIKDDVDQLDKTNQELRQDLVELQNRLEDDVAFAESMHALLVPGALTGERIVLVDFDGIDGSIIEDTTQSLEESGGEIVSSIRMDGGLALEDETAIEELAAALGSNATDAAILRGRLGHDLGSAAAEAAMTASTTAGDRLAELLGALTDAGFAEVASAGETPVPFGSIFVVVGGGAGAGYQVAEVTTPLTLALGRAGVAVAAGDSSEPEEEWGIVDDIRGNADALDQVSTVDQVQTAPGRIALVLALEDMDREGRVHHLGVNDGAEAVIPLPTPTS